MSEDYKYDNLFAGDAADLVTYFGTLITGQNLKRGAVLAQITASGKLTLVQSDGTDDGTRTPFAVLAEDCDATSSDKTVPLYIGGEFNGTAFKFGGTDTVTTHWKGLRDIGIIVKTNQAA